MAWTTPKTWSNAEVPTAALFNTHIRDNSNLLKTAINDNGKFIALTSDYVDDLSGAALTGVGKLASASTYTAGKQRFDGGATTRLVLPVGADKFDGTGGNKTAGSMWVETDYLHHVSDTQVEWRYLGTFVSTPGGGALPGSIWFESDGWHYIDEDGDERLAAGSAGAHSDASAIGGSFWVETYVHHIAAGGTSERYLHDDVTHSDSPTGTHTDSHTDSTPHSDSHSDTHSDVAHADSHTDTTHGDTHADHVDVGHADAHGDVAHGDSHSDTSHTDSHTDSHSDSTSHNDSHTDHADHADVAHQDNPENMGT